MVKKDYNEGMPGDPKNQLTRRDLLKMGFSSAMVSMLMGSAKTIGITGVASMMYGCGGGGGGDSGSSGVPSGSTVNVSGVMLDSSGTSCPGAVVTIQSTPVVVMTDGSGHFSAEVPPGVHTINITKEGQAIYNNSFTAVIGTPVSLGILYPTTPYYLPGSGSTTTTTTRPPTTTTTTTRPPTTTTTTTTTTRPPTTTTTTRPPTYSNAYYNYYNTVYYSNYFVNSW
jgi:hypothetical protein